MAAENNEAYINMRKSLDSLRDVVLADYALIETEDEQKNYSDFVTENVKAFLNQNAGMQQEVWNSVEDKRIQSYRNHAEHLLANKDFSLCPPGFRDENGICVPI